MEVGYRPTFAVRFSYRIMQSIWLLMVFIFMGCIYKATFLVQSELIRRSIIELGMVYWGISLFVNFLLAMGISNEITNRQLIFNKALMVIGYTFPIPIIFLDLIGDSTIQDSIGLLFIGNFAFWVRLTAIIRSKHKACNISTEERRIGSQKLYFLCQDKLQVPFWLFVLTITVGTILIVISLLFSHSELVVWGLWAFSFGMIIHSWIMGTDEFIAYVSTKVP